MISVENYPIINIEFQGEIKFLKNYYHYSGIIEETEIIESYYNFGNILLQKVELSYGYLFRIKQAKEFNIDSIILDKFYCMAEINFQGLSNFYVIETNVLHMKSFVIAEKKSEIY